MKVAFYGLSGQTVLFYKICAIIMLPFMESFTKISSWNNALGQIKLEFCSGDFLGDIREVTILKK